MLGQLLEGIRQEHCLFATAGLAARGTLWINESRVQRLGRSIKLVDQFLFEPNISPPRAVKLAKQVGQSGGQDASQPAHEFRFRGATKSVEVPQGLDERFLNDIRRIHFDLQAASNL
jgi:hypothetical protein